MQEGVVPVVASISNSLVIASQCLFLAVLVVAALWAIDEIFFELLRRRLSRRVKTASAGFDTPQSEATAKDNKIAILIPAWRDWEKLQSTVAALINASDPNQAIFIGCWQEDAKSRAEAARLSCQYPQVHHCDVNSRYTGLQAACINEIVDFVRLYEDDTGDEFAGYLIHNPGDVLHPDLIALVAEHLDHSDIVRLPRTADFDQEFDFVGGINADRRCEFFEKEMASRACLGTVSSAEIAFAFSSRIFASLSGSVGAVEINDVNLLNPSSLAPEYELTLRLNESGQSSVSAPFKRTEDDDAQSSAQSIVGVTSRFPVSFKETVVERCRTILGTSIDGWSRHGWSGSWSHKYGQWRDRRELILGFALFSFIFGAILTVLFAFALGAQPKLELLTELSQPAVAMLALVSLGLIIKVVNRHIAVARLRSTGALPGVLPRMVVEFWISAIAVVMAVRCWLRGSSRVTLRQGLNSAGHFRKFDASAGNSRVFKTGPFEHQPIGELLIDWHVLNRADRDRALSEQSESGQRIGRILVNKGLVTESTILEAVAHQISVDMVEINAHAVPASLGALLPLRSMLKHRVYPFRYSEDNSSVMLACYRLPQPDAVLALRGEIGSPIRLCLAKRSDVRQLLRKYSQLSRVMDRRFIAASTESVDELFERINLQAAQRRRTTTTQESRPLLGESLVRAGHLDRRALRKCLLHAVRTDQSLSDYLIKHELVPVGAIDAVETRMARTRGIRLATIDGREIISGPAAVVGNVDQG